MEDIRITVAAAAERADVDTAAKIIYPSLKSNSEYRNMLIDMLCTSVFSQDVKTCRQVAAVLVCLCFADFF